MSGRVFVRIAAIVLGANAIGFGIFCLPAIRNLLAGRGIPYVMGFPAYGRGPFEQHGLRTSVPLLMGFLAVCAVEAVSGWMLWVGDRSGAFLALATLPFGAIYWWGFALPLAPIAVGLGTVFLLLGWSSLR